MKAILHSNTPAPTSGAGTASLPQGWSIMPTGPEKSGCSNLMVKLHGEELEAHRPMLERFVRGRVRGSQDTEDIVQTVFMRALSNLESFRGECPLSQWLLRIAINEVKLYYSRVLPKRASQVSIEFVPEAFEVPAESPEEDHSTAERLLEAAGIACTADEARVLEFVYRGESFDRIAILLGIPASTVRSQFMRGRGKLLAYLYVHDPELLGGTQAIAEGVGRAMADEPTMLTRSEADSLKNPNRRLKHLRSACLKIARFLPAPTLLVALIGAINGTF